MLIATNSGQIITTRPAMQNIPDLMVSMVELDDDSVQRVRKTAENPPRVSVYDVLGGVTGYAPEDRNKLFQRLCEQFPEVRTICTNFKFPGRGQRDTPVTDAEGITQIIMLLPGRAAAIARQSAANVVVRYLGGDVSLVREIMANRDMQAQLEPDHPASIFGQSVRQGPLPHEIEAARNARMQALNAAFTLAQAIDSSSLGRLRVDYHVAEPHVEAAESSEVQSKYEVEVLPPSQPDGGHSVAESLVERAEEAEQAVEPSIANKPDGVQAASKARMSASKAVRRRAAQKARKRRGK
jgi:hypothetical protein